MATANNKTLLKHYFLLSEQNHVLAITEDLRETELASTLIIQFPDAQLLI